MYKNPCSSPTRGRHLDAVAHAVRKSGFVYARCCDALPAKQGWSSTNIPHFQSRWELVRTMLHIVVHLLPCEVCRRFAVSFAAHRPLQHVPAPSAAPETPTRLIVPQQRGSCITMAERLWTTHPLVEWVYRLRGLVDAKLSTRVPNPAISSASIFAVQRRVVISRSIITASDCLLYLQLVCLRLSRIRLLACRSAPRIAEAREELLWVLLTQLSVLCDTMHDPQMRLFGQRLRHWLSILNDTKALSRDNTTPPMDSSTSDSCRRTPPDGRHRWNRLLGVLCCVDVDMRCMYQYDGHCSQGTQSDRTHLKPQLYREACLQSMTRATQYVIPT